MSQYPRHFRFSAFFVDHGRKEQSDGFFSLEGNLFSIYKRFFYLLYTGFVSYNVEINVRRVLYVYFHPSSHLSILNMEKGNDTSSPTPIAENETEQHSLTENNEASELNNQPKEENEEKEVGDTNDDKNVTAKDGEPQDDEPQDDEPQDDEPQNDEPQNEEKETASGEQGLHTKPSTSTTSPPLPAKSSSSSGSSSKSNDSGRICIEFGNSFSRTCKPVFMLCAFFVFIYFIPFGVSYLLQRVAKIFDPTYQLSVFVLSEEWNNNFLFFKNLLFLPHAVRKRNGATTPVFETFIDTMKLSEESMPIIACPNLDGYGKNKKNSGNANNGNSNGCNMSWKNTGADNANGSSGSGASSDPYVIAKSVEESCNSLEQILDTPSSPPDDPVASSSSSSSSVGDASSSSSSPYNAYFAESFTPHIREQQQLPTTLIMDEDEALGSARDGYLLFWTKHVGGWLEYLLKDYTIKTKKTYSRRRDPYHPHPNGDLVQEEKVFSTVFT